MATGQLRQVSYDNLLRSICHNNTVTSGGFRMDAMTGNLTPRILVLETDIEQCHHIQRCLTARFAVTIKRPDEDNWLADDTAPNLVIAVVDGSGAGSRLLIERVRHHSMLETVPLLLVTPVSDPESRALLLEQGAQDTVQMPFAPGELLNR